MAASLQERLNYLVNYSSQLIFVGGDSLSSQTKALESFLFQQGENTEIAYIVAESDTDVAELRRQLCQQLLGHASMFYHRPLNECLASLNNFEGPVMIAITRAEKIPKKLLQELWELVLQSRFAGNKQHLNVILFADKRWAQEAKSWLPANNSGTPLLLSTQQASLYKAMPDSGLPHPQLKDSHTQLQPLSDAEHEIEQRPLFSMGAFWAAVILLLTCALVGVTVWQKGDQVSELFSPLMIESAQPDAIEIENDAKIPVAAWRPTVQAEITKPELATESVGLIETAAQTSIDVNTTPTQPEGDAQDTDIESVADLNGTQTIIDEISPVNTSEPEQTPTAVPAPIVEPSPEPVALSAENSAVESTDEGMFESGLYAIQLGGFQDENVLWQFITRNALLEVTQVYTTQRQGSGWFVVISNELYPSVEAARQGIADLPDYPSRNRAFVKATSSINQELAKR